VTRPDDGGTTDQRRVAFEKTAARGTAPGWQARKINKCPVSEIVSLGLVATWAATSRFGRTTLPSRRITRPSALASFDVSRIMSLVRVRDQRFGRCGETKRTGISAVLALPAPASRSLVLPMQVMGLDRRRHAGNVADPMRTAKSDETRFVPNRTNRASNVKSIENRPSRRWDRREPPARPRTDNKGSGVSSICRNRQVDRQIDEKPKDLLRTYILHSDYASEGCDVGSP